MRRRRTSPTHAAGPGPSVGKARCRSTLPVNIARTLQVLERVFAQCAVVADLLDLEHAPIGGKANAAQLGQVAQQSSHDEVAGVVDGGLKRSARPSLWFTSGRCATL